MIRSIQKNIVGVLLVVLVTVLLALPSYASKDNPPIVLSLANEYIRFYWGMGNTVDFKIGDDSYSWDVAGRWAVSTINGDPETMVDDYVDLIPRARDWGVDADGNIDYDHGYAPCHKFAYIKVKVGDNTPSVIGVSGGSWTKYPDVFRVPDGLGLGKNGRFLEGEWTTSENVAVLMTVYLVRDQVRWQFQITNRSSVSQTVGLQMQAAAGNEIQRSGFYGAPVFVSGFGSLEYGKTFTSNSVPDVIEKMNSIASPTVIARNILSGQDAVKPNRIALGNQNDLVGFIGYLSTSDIDGGELEMWLEPHAGSPNGSYNPDVRILETNPAWAACWDRRVLNSGASRRIITYYGVGVTDAVWTVKTGNIDVFDSAVLAVQSTRSLKYKTTEEDGPNQPGGPGIPGQPGVPDEPVGPEDPEEVDFGDLSPAIFSIKAYVYNLATDKGVYDLGDVNVKLQLPEGLTLVGGKAVQNVGYIGRDDESPAVEWSVLADGSVSGSLEYFVIAQDSISGWNQIVARKILVPATGKGTFAAGWQLVSVPFLFGNDSPNYVFDKYAGQIFPQYWNLTGSGSGSYRPLTSVSPGEGFWVYATGGGVGPFSVASDKKIYGENNGTQNNPIYIDLKPGWNLVGSPFLYPVYWGQIQFYNKTQNLALPLEKAVTSGWLNNMYFAWNVEKKKYDYFTSPLNILEPWKGYWIKAKKTVTMIINPLQWPGSDVIVPPGG